MVVSSLINKVDAPRISTEDNPHVFLTASEDGMFDALSGLFCPT
jgi:hypothetical protein